MALTFLRIVLSAFGYLVYGVQWMHFDGWGLFRLNAVQIGTHVMLILPDFLENVQVLLHPS
jgi:hypothetical protein